MPDSLTKKEWFLFLAMVKLFFWDEPYLFKYYLGQITRRCNCDSEFMNILLFRHDHVCGSHFRRKKIDAKVLYNGFYWPT